MADLFDQLKAQGPIKKSDLSPAKFVPSTKSIVSSSVEHLIEKCKSSSTEKRRESLPSPITVDSIIKTSKSRSLSPPKYAANSVIKSLKVKLERKKLEEFLTRPLDEHANNIRKKQEKFKDDNKIRQPKMTPTKAQQKLFEPPADERKSTDETLKQFKIKPCKVRIRRDNLQKLSKDIKNKNVAKKDGKFKTQKRPSSSFSESPPLKKSKSSTDNKNSKSKNSFFIKLNTLSPSKMERKMKNISKLSSSSTEALNNKIKNSKFNTTTTPTKFSRTQLLQSFGKRFFNVQVKIERCTHPLVLTFESNDRARRSQAKRNKSKNLSVSFREQVEIFGGSSDSEDSCDEDFSAIANNRNKSKANVSHRLPTTLTPVVMPARLKKVENGKVVDDIELDPSLFIDPKIFISSSPYSPGRKKRDHKSYSPLKDESSPSPRKEQLKLANEKIPPSGLRRLNIDEEDDEDDDCEYIVPIELPQRRTSRTSSNATLDDLTSVSLTLPDSPISFPTTVGNDLTTDKINLSASTNDENMSKSNNNNIEMQDIENTVSVVNLENGSDESFQSARDNMENNNENHENDDKFPSLNVSPTSGFDVESHKSNNLEQLQQTNGNLVKQTNANNSLNSANTIGDIAMNLFLEDSQINEDDDTHSKSFVDILINETIDKLTKDIDGATSDKHCSGDTT